VSIRRARSKRSSSVSIQSTIVVVPIGSTIDPGCDFGFQQLERRGYKVRLVHWLSAMAGGPSVLHEYGPGTTGSAAGWSSWRVGEPGGVFRNKCSNGKDLHLARRLANCSPIGEQLASGGYLGAKTTEGISFGARQASGQWLASWREPPLGRNALLSGLIAKKRRRYAADGPPTCHR
jgi:hypothetical protein